MTTQAALDPTNPLHQFLAEGRNQVLDALNRLEIDPQKLLRAPWDAVHDVVGPIWPSDLWALCAGTGNGKTSTGAHFIHDWVSHGRKVYVITLEQKPSEHRTALAALSLGLHPQWCLENNWDKLGRTAKERLRAEVTRQTVELEARLLFSPTPILTVRNLEAEFGRAYDLGADIIVVDHLNKVQTKSYQELEEFMGILKQGANDLDLPVLTLVQVSARKEGDPLSPYLPPNPFHMKGGEVIREHMSTALGLYRPLVETFSKEDERDVRRGRRKIRDFVEPNTMGFTVMKSRLRGAHVGDIIKLSYKQGRILCPQTEDRTAYERRQDL